MSINSASSIHTAVSLQERPAERIQNNDKAADNQDRNKAENQAQDSPAPVRADNRMYRALVDIYA